jgi:hypothetical protein
MSANNQNEVTETDFRDITTFRGAITKQICLYLILGRLLRAIDHQHVDGTFSRFQFQAELLLNRGENRKTGRIGSCVWSGDRSAWLERTGGGGRIGRPLELIS